MAQQYDGEVVIADSRQIYRGMNIGTGKVTPEEMRWIPHHMLDIRDISELYGVGEFAPEARRIIAEIHARGKLPILSGGTGLFIDAVVGNFTIPEVVADWEYRDELEAFRLEHGNEALWEKLYAVDPDYATELDPRNYRYVIRGLEIWKETGQSKKLLGQKTESPYDFLRITPYDWDREKLYDTINRRVEVMFQNGLIEEVSQLIQNSTLPTGRQEFKIQNDTTPSSSGNWEKAERREVEPGIQVNNYAERANTLQGNDNWPGFRVADVPARSSLSDAHTSELKTTQWTSLPGMTETELLEKLPGLNAIGYREIIPYLAGTQSLETTIEFVQTNSRHYAKRQLTWFRRYASMNNE
jgi:tRNA dimethylallyltransferase